MIILPKDVHVQRHAGRGDAGTVACGGRWRGRLFEWHRGVSQQRAACGGGRERAISADLDGDLECRARERHERALGGGASICGRQQRSAFRRGTRDHRGAGTRASFAAVTPVQRNRRLEQRDVFSRNPKHFREQRRYRRVDRAHELPGTARRVPFLIP